MDDHASYAETIAGYAGSELDDILHHIDRAKFPERYLLVVDEIAKRAAARNVPKELDSAVAQSQHPHEKPQTLRELIADLVQPVEGMTATRVTFADRRLPWIVLGLLAVLTIPEIMIIQAADGVAIRGAAALLIAIQIHAAWAMILRRPCTSFCLRCWSVVLIAYGAINAGTLIGIIGESLGSPSPSPLILVGTVILIGAAVFVAAERCVTPVFPGGKVTS